ncbi:MAG: hypothetical protein FWF08_09165 [Oscillospiraceae bacterium]|nr:hypothetical protein [Oscillospiraceae bacterium]
MKVSLISFSADDELNKISLKAKISSVFRVYCGRVPIIADYKDFKEAAPHLADALKNSDITVIMASKNCFGEIKEKFCRAMSLKMETRFDLFEKISGGIGEESMKSPKAAAHIDYPAECDIISFDDGFFSGFSVHAGKKYAVFLPFAEDRILDGINRHVLKILRIIYNAEQKVKDASYGFLVFLKNRKLRVAVAKTKTADFIEEKLAHQDGFDEYVKLLPLKYKQDQMTPAEYTVKLSFDALDTLGFPYAIAMSDVYKQDAPEGGSGLYVCLAVAGGGNADVKQFFPKKNEDMESFLYAAANELFTMLKDRVGDDGIDFTQ